MQEIWQFVIISMLLTATRKIKVIEIHCGILGHKFQVKVNIADNPSSYVRKAADANIKWHYAIQQEKCQLILGYECTSGTGGSETRWK